MRRVFCSALLLFLAVWSGRAAESELIAKPGLKGLQLAADRISIVPGETFSVGLLIQHLPEYHTYWKGPGIVGVPTTIKWELPPGFSAAEIEWPVPEQTKMAAYSCNGYQRDVVLLSRISVPASLEAEVGTVTLKARVAYMCCAKTCHPGWHDFELVLKVKAKDPEVDAKWNRIFTETRRSEPRAAPPSWNISLLDAGQAWLLAVSADQSFAQAENAHFFCEHNLVHSDLPQIPELSADRRTFTLTLPQSKFAPSDVTRFAGLLFHPKGWPGTDSKWVRIHLALPSSD